MRLWLTLVGLVIYAVGNISMAQSHQLTSRQTEILQDVLRVDGSLTKMQYDEFWAGFRNLSDAECERFRKSFRSEAPRLLAYQRTLWMAASESLKQQRPVITPDLISELRRAEQNGSRSASHDKRVQDMKRQAQELLDAAAYGTTVVKNGRNIKVTSDMIEQVLSGLDGSLSRLERLLSVSWQPNINAGK